MEPAEAATALDSIFKDSASASMANKDDEQLPNTLKQSLALIEAEVEHAANLEHSKSGCLAAVCERNFKKAAVEGVPAGGDVYQQFRRALKDESLKGEYEQCKSRQAKDLFRKEWTTKCVKVLQSRLEQTKVFERDRNGRIDHRLGWQSRRATTQKQPRVIVGSVELGPPFLRWDKFSMQFKFLALRGRLW